MEENNAPKSVKTMIIEYLETKTGKHAMVKDISNAINYPSDTIRRTINRSIENNEDIFEYQGGQRYRFVRIKQNGTQDPLDIEIEKKMLQQFAEKDLPADDYTDEEWERITQKFSEYFGGD
jgi:hypothetical protein